MATVVDLADAAALADGAALADLGGKARGLARLIAAGLPTPPGAVLPGAVFADVVGALTPGLPLAQHGHALAALAEAAAHATPTPALVEAVGAAIARLGPRLAVRSSMAVEDTVAGAAPGVGATVLGVAPAQVWDAIRQVWVAAVTPLVVAYARARGQTTVAPPAVIIQAQVAGFRATIYTRPPGQPDGAQAWIACGPGAPARVARSGAAWREALTLALAAERAIAAPTGADVELVWAFATRAWTIVQARPLVHPPPRPPRVPAPAIVLAPLRTPARAWRRDVTHNPAPLSVAQAELCARVDAAAIAPFHLKVVAHHLYWAPRLDAPAPPPVTVATLPGELAALEAEVAGALAAPAAALDDALRIYLAAYRVLAAELGPRIAAALAILPDALAARGQPRHLAAALAPHRPSSIAARLAACARGQLDRAALLAAIGDAAAAWDVMAPTFAETPALLERALAAAASRPAPPDPPATPPGLADAVTIARLAVDAAERDDLWYWRAQAVVRRALLACADRRGLDRADVFWLPFARLLDDAPLTAATARGHAAAARAAAARAAAWDLPLAVDDAPPAAVAPPTDRFVGAGVGGTIAGPVHRTDGAQPVPRGAVVVARAITPALALLVDGAAALVSEHGSPLDHGAAMARELGIPCVVGCPGVYDGLDDGAWVTVDGDAGVVRRA
ncbi:MAG: hypothetical protein IPL61_34290 [Myxococcales bacterium]|nr:hypothetical protein [Myxococcales bacterium]